MKALLTAKEAAVLLAIGLRKLWTLTNQGAIQSVRIGRSVRYRPEDLERFVESAARKGGSR